MNSKRPETRAALVSEIESKMGIAAIAVDDAESAVRDTDIVTEATRLDKPEVLICDGRGLEVSPCSLTQNQLLKDQVRNSPAKMLILFLKAFQFLHPVRSHAAILFAPAEVRLLRNGDRPNRVDPGLPVPDKNVNLS